MVTQGLRKRRNIENARKDRNSAQRMGRTAEAFNALGVLELQHRNPSIETAIKDFKAALSPKSPAFRHRRCLTWLLSLTNTLHGSHKLPLQQYREYMAVQPREWNAKEINAIIADLDRGG